MNAGDTIVALSTPAGRSGLGVLRLSGSNARPISERVLRFSRDSEWRSWHSRFASLVDEAEEIIDQAVVTFFQAPRSYTGEDVVEISCHGSPVVLRFCLERAVSAGARLAEPGEFTLRAYMRGRIDLPQAEAVQDLIDATTLYQARVAAQQLEGSVSKRIKPAKDQLLELIALLEAGIDFAEDDISVASSEEILRRLGPVQQHIRALVSSFESGKLVFQGFTLAIAGLPNVGKSSLFNRLLEQDRAIVTNIPGTTRDTVAETFSLHGIPVRLVDTAGIRKGQDIVEDLGVERSYQAMADADLTLLVLDRSREPSEEDIALIQRLSDRRPVIVGNKADLPRPSNSADYDIEVSATTGYGLEDLQSRILQRLAPDGMATPEDGSITNIRQAALLRESLEALENARRAVEFQIPHEMILIDLYAALRPIDAVTGATTADDILHRIFSTFCIGK